VPPGPCGTPYLGDFNAPIEIQISAMDGTGSEVTITNDGDPGPMLVAPQGGRVMFVGVRATNLDPCGVTLMASLRDTSSMQVRFDSRSVNLTARGDGWGTDGEPNGSAGIQPDYANVPVCPNQWSARDLFGQPYELAVTLTDSHNKTITKTIQTTPTCAGADFPGQPCTCICAHGYVLGTPCDDAGVGNGSEDASATD
jgi:hypothetical protein